MRNIKIILILILCGCLILFSSPLWADVFRDMPKASADDGQESPNGAINISFGYLELMLNDAVERWGVAIRIPNVTIAQGATVDSAWLKVYKYATWAHVYDTVACHNVDSATSISTGSYNISNRWVTTTTKVLWHEIYEWDDTYVRTCELTSIIQEILNRTGWKSGNAMMFLFKNKAAPDSSAFEIYAWDGVETARESLIVYYTPAEEEVVMRVPDDWQFRTSFFPWEFQDVEVTEWRVVNIYGEEPGQILNIFDGEVVEIYGEKNKRLTKDDWKKK